MSALTLKADVQREVMRLVPRQSGHQMGTWGDFGKDSGWRVVPNSLIVNGGQGQNRTADTRIFSPLLHQLSNLANFDIRSQGSEW